MNGSKPKDMAGQKFGRLLVTSISDRKDKTRSVYWNVLCDCGAEKEVRGTFLRNGAIVSCGCFNGEQVAKATRLRCTTHGHSKRGHRTAAYRSWHAMKVRCTLQTDKAYPNYGGRGITVCSRWIDSFENFLADMGNPPPGTSLDRINNDGNYEPGNCRWATAKEQARNTRRNVIVEIDGVRKCVTEWCEIVGMNPVIAISRIYNGWSPLDAVTKEVWRSNRAK